MKVIWAVVLVVLVLVGAQGAKMLNTSREVERSNYSESISGNMLVYRNHVIAYAVAHPTATGEIADASLGLPAWFKKSQERQELCGGGARLRLLHRNAGRAGLRTVASVEG